MKTELRKTEFVEAYHEDGKAWRVILRHMYEEWKPGIIKQIIISGGSQEDAEDVFQDGVLEFISNLLQDRFEERSSLKTYLTVICKYMWFSMHKKENRRSEILEQLDLNINDESSLDFVIHKESYALLHDVLGQLGERCRELLTF
ncbi:MAG: sigma-70 family RNA polymerase sigma factor, partial [Saprospiraceae bacterium]|nr:sigma-70 family RNA polymerase sigma factor [Saprospiraceae bacterium]